MQRRVIRVSHNELAAVLKRFFEYLGNSGGDYTDGADKVVWLESRGLPAVRALLDARPRQVRHESPKPVRITTGDTTTVVDVRGQSMFVLATTLVDMAVTHRQSDNPLQVRLENCINRIALVAAVGQHVLPECAVTAWWMDERQSLLHVVRARGCGEEFCYQVSAAAPESVADAASANLFFAQNPGAAADVLPIVQPEDVRIELDAGELDARREASLNNGIELAAADFAQLCEVADLILVESSAQSRHGAGD